MGTYSQPGTEGSVVSFKPRYENFIGGAGSLPSKDSTSKIPRP